MYNKLSNAIKAANQKSLFSKTALLTSSAAIVLMGMTAQVYAQEAAAEGEEIVVTGIRGALKNAVDIKRNSDAVLDAISAEDVGKFPDADVGESLGRIPGVSVGRQFGQGQQISIRGASSQYTNTQLNGHTVATSGWFDQQSIDRSFYYGMMPSEMVGGIKVYKSSQADLSEGGIGGTVIVESRKPLDLDANAVFVSVKGDYGSVSEEVDPEISGLYSFKNDSETFGILAAASVKKTDYLRAGTEVLLGWGGSVAPSAFHQDRENTAFNIAAQYKPTDELEFGVNHMSLKMEGNNDNTSLFLFPNAAKGTDAGCTQSNAAGVCTLQTRSGGTGWNDVNAWAQTWVRESSMDSKTTTADFKFATEGVTLDGLIGTTKSDGGTTLTANYGWAMQNHSGGYDGTFDATGDTYKVNTKKKSFTVADWTLVDISTPDQAGRGPAGKGWGPEGWSLKGGPRSDKEDFLKLNASFDVNLGAIESIKTGISAAKHEVNTTQFIYANNAKYDGVPTDFWTGEQNPAGNGFMLPKPNFDAMMGKAKSVLTTATLDNSAEVNLEEKNNAAYVMFNFKAEGVSGNFGLRYINTDISSDYHPWDVTKKGTAGYDANGYRNAIATAESEYHDVLPSANVSFDLTDSLKLRTSLSEVVSRPNYENLFANTTQIGTADGTKGNEALFTGSVSLKPVKAAQADLGLEWYYGNGNMLSATYFLKDFSTFTVIDLKQHQTVGLNNDSGVDDWTIATAKDGSGAKIDGLELQALHAWDSGFGVSLNYTYANGTAPANAYPDQLGVFSDSSKHTVNAVGYWENDVYSARLAYNWRSEFMIREGQKFYGNRMQNAYGSLDVSLGWKVTDTVRLSFEGVNLTKSDTIQTGTASPTSNVKIDLQAGYPAWSFEGEARYMLGVSFKM
jgi:iron complex outermembrane receptor protein